MSPEEKKLKKKEYQKKYRELNKEKLKLKKKEYDKIYNEKNREKINKRCKEYRLKTPNTNKEWKELNKEHIKEYSKKYYEDNRNIIIEKTKVWVNNNQNKKQNYNNKWFSEHPDYNKNYYKKNKEKILEYQKYRLINDPLFKLKRVLRRTISRSLTNKKNKTHEILGCSYEEFKTYLEAKFESWMTWENYGLYNGELNYGWDIDHIIPLSSTKFEDEIIKLNHYTNLQPLCSKVNRDIKKAII
jgi:hypothetical protein